MTLDEAIKHCLEVAEGYEIRVKLGGELTSLIDCPQQAANYRKIAELLMELKEAKRLLKLAGEDIESLRPYLAEPYSRMYNEKWRYADEAKKLLDE